MYVCMCVYIYVCIMYVCVSQDSLNKDLLGLGPQVAAQVIRRDPQFRMASKCVLALQPTLGFRSFSVTKVVTNKM
jgi:hypothetical protein